MFEKQDGLIILVLINHQDKQIQVKLISFVSVVWSRENFFVFVFVFCFAFGIMLI